MTIANFKDLVASYSNRTAASFTSIGSQDVILAAMNDARRDAQRRYRFNLAKRTAFVQLSLLGKSMLTAFAADPSGSGTAVVVNRLDELWEYGTASVSATTVYYPTLKLDYRPRASLEFAVPGRPWPWQNSTGSAATSNFAYNVGTTVYHSNLLAPTWYMAYVSEFLGDLSSGDSPDFFLIYFADWLKFATMGNLNIWLKDSDRFNFDQTVITNLWNSVIQFDAQQETVGSIDLS